jgi:hypothetical protein
MISNDDNAKQKSSQKQTLAESVRELQRRAALAEETTKTQNQDHSRREPVFDAYCKIYEPARFVFGQDTATERDWEARFAQRIIAFGIAVNNAGYADRVRELNYDEHLRATTDDDFAADSVRLALDLIKEGLFGDVHRILALLRLCPIDPARVSSPRWDIPFNDRRLLTAILEPLQSRRGAAQSSEGIAAADIEPVLNARQRRALVALLKLGAVDSDRLQTTEAVTARLAVPDADANQYKKVIAALNKIGYVSTKEGRGGGCWLTDDGRERAEKLKHS